MTTPLDFTDLNTAIAEVKQLAAITGTDSDQSIATMLDASAGINAQGQKVYRPYLAAAFQIAIPPLIQRSYVYQAKGVSFALPKDIAPAIRDLLLMQKAFDCNLKISHCWLIDSIMRDMGLKEKIRPGMTAIVSGFPV